MQPRVASWHRDGAGRGATGLGGNSILGKLTSREGTATLTPAADASPSLHEENVLPLKIGKD